MDRSDCRERLNTTQLNGVSTMAEEWMVRGSRKTRRATRTYGRAGSAIAYGRLVTQKSRGHGTVPNITYDATTSYAYFGPTSVASSDTTGGITTGYAYAWDATAQTNKVTATDAAGKTIYTRTNAMGLSWRIWGYAAQPIEYGYERWAAQHDEDVARGLFHGNRLAGNTGHRGDHIWVYDAPTSLLQEKRYADHVEGTTNGSGSTPTPRSARSRPARGRAAR